MTTGISRRSAGDPSSTGSGDTSLGVATLQSYTSGEHNTAIGWSSMRNTLTGALYAINYESLAHNAAGNDNTALGEEALHLTTGSGNIGIGSLGGFAPTTGATTSRSATRGWRKK